MGEVPFFSFLILIVINGPCSAEENVIYLLDEIKIPPTFF